MCNFIQKQRAILFSFVIVFVLNLFVNINAQTVVNFGGLETPAR